MGMTVIALHRELTRLIKAGHGRKPVCIDKPTFTHPCEQDGATILEIGDVIGPNWIGMADDDGGTKWNKDGSESGRHVVMLKGDRE